MMRSVVPLGFAHLLGNAVVLWLGYYWLGIGEARAAMLAWSAFVALLVLILLCAIHGTAFAFFSEADKRRVVPAAKTALRNLMPLACAAIGVIIIYSLLALVGDYTSKPALKVASFLTLKLRTPVRPASVMSVFGLTLLLVRWVVLPVLFVPLLGSISTHGWRGFRSLGTHVPKWLYWIEAPVLVVLAVWVPFKLLGWVPQLKSFGLEVTSFTLRAAVAYLLFVAALLALAFATSAGKPRFTQSRTAISP